MPRARKPFVKRLSEEESNEILTEAMKALERGDEDEYDRLGLMFPVSPEMADDLKKSIGIKALVESGINLIEALDTYGENWLRD